MSPELSFRGKAVEARSGPGAEEQPRAENDGCHAQNGRGRNADESQDAQHDACRTGEVGALMIFASILPRGIATQHIVLGSNNVTGRPLQSRRTHFLNRQRAAAFNSGALMNGEDERLIRGWRLH